MGKLFPFLYMAFTLVCCSCQNQAKDFINADILPGLEESLYRSNLEHLKRGKYFRFHYESELAIENEENRLLLSRLRTNLDQMDSIDAATVKMIRFIDEVKLDLLKRNHESIQALPRVKPEDKSLWSKRDEKDPLLPLRLDLAKLDPVKYPDINPLSSAEKPLPQGEMLWKSLISYRAEIVRLTASYKSGDRHFNFRPQAINTFKDHKDLTDKVMQMVEAGNINHREDEQTLQDIYILLTKPGQTANGQHWVTFRFGNLPLAAMINNLSVLQNEILGARAMAISHVAYKRTYCGSRYFKDIQFKIIAPDSVRKGEEIKLYVFLAGFEYYLEPEFVCDQVQIESVENGIATIRLTANGKDEMLLSGTVSFELPTGELYGFPWKKVIRIENRL